MATSAALSTTFRNEQLADQISTLAAHIHAATFRFLSMIREFDERQAWLDTGSKSCAHWLNWRCGMSVHTAREKIRTAHALQPLEKISAAFARGELSYSKVRAVTRVATPLNEDIFLNIALHGTASQLERMVRHEVRTEKEAQLKENTQVAFDNRGLSWRAEADGSVSFFGNLPAELAEHVICAIEASIESDGAKSVSAETALEDAALQPEYARKKQKEGTEQKQVKEVTEIEEVKESQEAQKLRQAGEEATAKSPASVSAKAKRADALVALCQQYCTGYEVTVHVSAGTSLRANAMENSGPIPIDTAKRLCCDAAIVPITEDEDGNPLDIGRRTRVIPPAIRRTLSIRDKECCRFPGCDHTQHLQGHHIKHWANGGKTCLDNLVLLCWHHHHLVHEEGYLCKAVPRTGGNESRTGNGKGVDIVFGKPNGVIIPDAFRLSPITDELETHHSHINISADTCSAADCTTKLDVGVVVDALRFREERGY